MAHMLATPLRVQGLQRTGTVVVMDSFGAVRKLQQSLNVAGVSLFVRLLTVRRRLSAGAHFTPRSCTNDAPPGCPTRLRLAS